MHEMHQIFLYLFSIFIIILFVSIRFVEVWQFQDELIVVRLMFLFCMTLSQFFK